MDIDEVKALSTEMVFNQICSGNDFKGLGSTARYLVMFAAQEADANAQHIWKRSTRTPDKYQLLQGEVSREFTTSILGIDGKSASIKEAVGALIDRVWDAYMDWAKEAKLADLAKADAEQMRSLAGKVSKA